MADLLDLFSLETLLFLFRRVTARMNVLQSAPSAGLKMALLFLCLISHQNNSTKLSIEMGLL